jgi:alkylated DNA repair protein (DNA oxidative demethylase)
MTGHLFDMAGGGEPWPERLGPGTVLLHGFAVADVATLLADLRRIVNAAPFRHMVTPGGQLMSVAMTNCGALVWG